MNRSMRKFSGAFLIVVSTLVGIAQVSSADYSEVLADVNAKKEACRAAARSEPARYCFAVCRRAADRIARAKDANTVEKLKAGCDERYEAVGFGTADAPVAVQQAGIDAPAPVTGPIPDVEGSLTMFDRKNGLAKVESSDTGPWAAECRSAGRVIDIGDVPNVRDPTSAILVRLVGIQVPPAGRYGRRPSCSVDRIELISP